MGLRLSVWGSSGELLSSSCPSLGRECGVGCGGSVGRSSGESSVSLECVKMSLLFTRRFLIGTTRLKRVDRDKA